MGLWKIRGKVWGQDLRKEKARKMSGVRGRDQKRIQTKEKSYHCDPEKILQGDEQ